MYYKMLDSLFIQEDFLFGIDLIFKNYKCSTSLILLFIEETDSKLAHLRISLLTSSQTFKVLQSQAKSFHYILHV